MNRSEVTTQPLIRVFGALFTAALLGQCAVESTTSDLHSAGDLQSSSASPSPVWSTDMLWLPTEHGNLLIYRDATLLSEDTLIESSLDEVYATISDAQSVLELSPTNLGQPTAAKLDTIFKMNTLAYRALYDQVAFRRLLLLQSIARRVGVYNLRQDELVERDLLRFAERGEQVFAGISRPSLFSYASWFHLHDPVGWRFNTGAHHWYSYKELGIMHSINNGLWLLVGNILADHISVDRATPTKLLLSAYDAEHGPLQAYLGFLNKSSEYSWRALATLLFPRQWGFYSIDRAIELVWRRSFATRFRGSRRYQHDDGYHPKRVVEDAVSWDQVGFRDNEKKVLVRVVSSAQTHEVISAYPLLFPDSMVLSFSDKPWTTAYTIPGTELSKTAQEQGFLVYPGTSDRDSMVSETQLSLEQEMALGYALLQHLRSCDPAPIVDPEPETESMLRRFWNALLRFCRRS